MFKLLASIAAWILFVWGVITIVSATIGYYTTIGIGQPPTMTIQISWGLGSVELVLAVVVMRLKQQLD